ncbi:MAG TPA: hypothetical protein VE404_10065 [Verrucomicrobiae bacterium]|nr:hypothetical protein [Verrucomicrobiae bacterium]
MKPSPRLALSLSVVSLALVTFAMPAPTVIALLSPPDGSVVNAASRPTFAFEATPGGRFRVEFSSTGSPFVPVLNSGRKTTPGDQHKPSMQEWREIVALGAATNTVYWRVIALHMTADEINAAPIASFTIAR